MISRKFLFLLLPFFFIGCMTAGSLNEKIVRMQGAIERAQEDLGRAQTVLGEVTPEKNLGWEDWVKILGGLVVTGGSSVLGVNMIRDKKYIAKEKASSIP